MTCRVESLTSLLRTIGASLDSSEKGPAMVCNQTMSPWGSTLLLIVPQMDAYFARIKMIIDIPGLNSRLRFMLMVCINHILYYAELYIDQGHRISSISASTAGNPRTLTRVPRPFSKSVKRFVFPTTLFIYRSQR